MSDLFGFEACPRKERGNGERKLRTSQFKLLPLPKVLALARAQKEYIGVCIIIDLKPRLRKDKDKHSESATNLKFEAEASECKIHPHRSVYKLSFSLGLI